MDHRRAAIAPPDTSAAFPDDADARLITLMWGVAKLIDEGSVDRFAGDLLYEAATHLQDSLDAALRTATAHRALSPD